MLPNRNDATDKTDATIRRSRAQHVAFVHVVFGGNVNSDRARENGAADERLARDGLGHALTASLHATADANATALRNENAYSLRTRDVLHIDAPSRSGIVSRSARLLALMRLP